MTGYSPFELDIGWNPRTPLENLQLSNNTTAPHASTSDVNSLLATLKTTFCDAQFAHRLAQARQSANNSSKCRPHSFKPGDYVWLDKRYFTDAAYKVQTSKKLASKRFGPFQILELIGKNAIKLKFPAHIRAHNVVHVEHVKEFRQQPPDISHPKPPPAQLHIDRHGESVIEIGKILAHRVRKNIYQFVALPKHAPTHEAAWQPLHDFVDEDKTITEALHSDIIAQDILHELH